MVWRINNLKEFKKDQDNGIVSKTEQMTYNFIIYVPENIPKEDFSKVLVETRKLSNSVNSGQLGSDGPTNVTTKFEIRYCGGNYDYGSTE